MKTFFVNLWSHLRSSYWFIPIVLAIVAMLLSICTITFDYWVVHNDGKYKSIEWLFIIRPDGARAILATIAGSMITVAGVTFSMTVLAVSFSMGQIGPRLIQNFMRDRANQFTLGIFIATFLYSILVLLTVVSANELGDNAFVPHVATLIAIILAIVCIGFFIFFIHHIPESINIFNLLAKIADEYQDQLNSLFPEKINLVDDNDSQEKLSNFCENSFPILSRENGYIRYLDKKALLKLAVEMDCTIAIKFQSGVFVTQGTPLIYVDKTLDEEHQDDCLKCFAIGHEKDQSHDILFLSDEIVEIIARALSPGINAPFIATTAIDWLQVMIETLSKREISNACLYDENHKLRIIAENITLAYFIDNVFGGIRSYVSHDRNALLHTLSSIKMMLLNSKSKQLNNSLKLNAEKIFSAANENLTSNEDKKEARESMEKIAKI